MRLEDQSIYGGNNNQLPDQARHAGSPGMNMDGAVRPSRQAKQTGMYRIVHPEGLRIMLSRGFKGGGGSQLRRVSGVRSDSRCTNAHRPTDIIRPMGFQCSTLKKTYSTPGSFHCPDMRASLVLHGWAALISYTMFNQAAVLSILDLPHRLQSPTSGHDPPSTRTSPQARGHLL